MAPLARHSRSHELRTLSVSMSASSQIKGSECHRFFRGACQDTNGAHSSLGGSSVCERLRRGFRHYFSVLGDFKGLRGGQFPPRSAKRPLAGGTISTVGPCGGRNKGGGEQTVARILLTRKKNRHIPFRRKSALANYDLSILVSQNGKSAR